MLRLGVTLALLSCATARASRQAQGRRKESSTPRSSVPQNTPEPLPAVGYLAFCILVRDQPDDLLEWISYHHKLGADSFLVFDDRSTPPLDSVLLQHIESGLVQYTRRPDDAVYPRQYQFAVYDGCIARMGPRYRWLAFIDVDEFIVLEDTLTLPALLKDFEDYGGLALNWRIFGSSGHLTRQSSTLHSYTSCLPADHPMHGHVKVIGQSAHLLRTGSDVHHFSYKIDKFTVNTNYERVDVGFPNNIRMGRASLYHYVLKSKEEFDEKLRRGGGDGNSRPAFFFDQMDRASTDQCRKLQSTPAALPIPSHT